MMSLKTRTGILLLLQFIIVSRAIGQDSLSDAYRKITSDRNLTSDSVGQVIPPNEIINMINHSSVSGAVKNPKGKLIIFDFWNTGCLGCIEAIYRVRDYENEFKDSLMIVPVTYESRNVILNFLARRKIIGNEFPFPVIYADTLIGKLFPHEIVPYEIWIDPNGKVMAMTSSIDITTNNISLALAGVSIQAKKAPAFITDIDVLKTLDKQLTPGHTSIRYRSSMTMGINNGSIESYIANDTITKILTTNHTAIELYKYAYGLLDKKNEKWLTDDVQDKRIIVQDADSGKFFDRWQLKTTSDFDDFLDNHLYCYDLMIGSESDKQQAIRMMIDDLDRLFKVRSSMQIKKISCLKLIPAQGGVSPTLKFKDSLYEYHSEQQLGHEISDDKKRFTASGLTMDILVLALNSQYHIPLLINSTFYKGPVNLELNLKSPDLKNIREQLRKFGLELQPAFCYRKVLVLQGE